MIKHLILTNFILVDNLSISLDKELNIITGETGSGKSALMEGISLMLGKRASLSLLRQKADSASVEAHFEISAQSPLWAILEEAGIHYAHDELLSIRRELTKEGKNKAYINCKLVPLPLLQQIGSLLIEVVDADAPHALREPQEQLKILDLFAENENLLDVFKKAYSKSLTLLKEIEKLKALNLSKNREMDLLSSQLLEIEKMNFKELEEETLFEEYSKLSSMEEHLQKAAILEELLSEILPKLAKAKNLSSLLKSQGLNEAYSLTQEASAEISSRLSDMALDPKRLEFLDKRLADLHLFKKKYGNTFQEVDAVRQNLLQKLEEFSHLEEILTEKEKELSFIEQTLKEASDKLSERRKEAALILGNLLSEEIRSLNMPSAEMVIETVLKPIGPMGKDEVIFYLKANKGETLASVKENISGGELCRLAFCIKSCLARKNPTPTILFDEIDANVGGTSATIMGQKLFELSQKRQVLCITHFAQVAKFASSHFVVSKQEEENRTITRIEHLKKESVERELQRMMGSLHTL